MSTMATASGVSDQSSAFGYGTYSIGEDGAWTYTLDNGNAAVDALGDGETLTDSFTALTRTDRAGDHRNRGHDGVTPVRAAHQRNPL